MLGVVISEMVTYTGVIGYGDRHAVSPEVENVYTEEGPRNVGSRGKKPASPTRGSGVVADISRRQDRGHACRHDGDLCVRCSKTKVSHGLATPAVVGRGQALRYVQREVKPQETWPLARDPENDA